MLDTKHKNNHIKNIEEIERRVSLEGIGSMIEKKSFNVFKKSLGKVSERTIEKISSNFDRMGRVIKNSDLLIEEIKVVENKLVKLKLNEKYNNLDVVNMPSVICMLYDNPKGFKGHYANVQNNHSSGDVVYELKRKLYLDSKIILTFEMYSLLSEGCLCRSNNIDVFNIENFFIKMENYSDIFKRTLTDLNYCNMSDIERIGDSGTIYWADVKQTGYINSDNIYMSCQEIKNLENNYVFKNTKDITKIKEPITKYSMMDAVKQLHIRVKKTMEDSDINIVDLTKLIEHYFTVIKRIDLLQQKWNMAMHVYVNYLETYKETVKEILLNETKEKAK